jgi:hypothetical protein
MTAASTGQACRKTTVHSVHPNQRASDSAGRKEVSAGQEEGEVAGAEQKQTAYEVEERTDKGVLTSTTYPQRSART